MNRRPQGTGNGSVDAGGARPWPPIIEHGWTSRGIRIRDVLLTLLAWAALFWLLSDMLRMAVDVLLYLVGIRDSLRPVSVRLIFDDLLPFLLMVSLLMLWLAFFVSVRWRTLNARRRRLDQPPPLEAEQQAAYWHLPPEQVLLRREAKVSTARFDGKGAPVGID